MMNGCEQADGSLHSDESARGGIAALSARAIVARESESRSLEDQKGRQDETNDYGTGNGKGSEE